jgi:hypothetical protein
MSSRGLRVWLWSCQLSTLLLATALIIVNGSATAAPGDFIRAEGTHLVDGNGARFAIKGINLGNWLVPEGYMFKFKRALSRRDCRCDRGPDWSGGRRALLD